MKISLLPIYVLLFISVDCSTIKAQDNCCGTGNIFSSILGSGIFGGYGFQQFGADGLNNIINSTPGLAENFDDFGFAYGWRVGANLIQVGQDDFLVALKFYYQSVYEQQEASGTYQGEDATQELNLQINNWSFGMSLSYVINENFDIRIFDALMTFPTASLKNKISTTSSFIEDEYESTESNIGFTFDAGLVYYPFPPYISLEVVGGYSFFSFETLETADGNILSSTSDIIDSGGFLATAVLTVGIPFD
ncbi:MAG: hypothetical protein ACHQLA_08080 [Ignavibacteriales bacterium]